MDDPHATLYLRLGREPLAALAHRLEKKGRCSRSCWFMIHRLSGEEIGSWTMTQTPFHWFAFGGTTCPVQTNPTLQLQVLVQLARRFRSISPSTRNLSRGSSNYFEKR